MVTCQTYRNRKGEDRAEIMLGLGDVARLLADAPGTREAFWSQVSDQLALEAEAHVRTSKDASASTVDPAGCSHPDRFVKLTAEGTTCGVCAARLDGAA
jgi:hypothetical protein